MSDSPSRQWWQALPPAEAEIPCGKSRHVIRWADGKLTLPAHPDPEAEHVLAALGGEKATCVDLAGMWDRHGDDLAVLTLGPRFAADQPDIIWDDIEPFLSRASPDTAGFHHRIRRKPGVAPRPVGPPGSGSPAPPSPLPARSTVSAAPNSSGLDAPQGPGFFPTSGPPGRGRVPAGGLEVVRLSAVGVMGAAMSHGLELLSLFALGPALLIRLAGTVSAAWAGADRVADREKIRPVLAAALTGRLAPAAGTWCGIDPDQVTASLHEGPGWGSLAATGAGDGQGLRASLPLAWLAEVWACGLAVVEDHLVIAVQQARWPDAHVLALPEPGADPIALTIRADPDPSDPATGPHWLVTGTG